MIIGDKLYPIEIKKSKSPKSPDKNFGAIDKFGLDVQPGVILCMADEMIPYDRNLWYFPVSAI